MGLALLWITPPSDEPDTGTWVTARTVATPLAGTATGPAGRAVRSAPPPAVRRTERLAPAGTPAMLKLNFVVNKAI
ncbi:hypothetical protein [Streptacidiphilus sp. MAP12-33]|uniref:hypothetical protein n=1 Tax=Streptacidiphilus sp. MAP12-33 TaxID=3156266 RepID=UPI0035163B88